MYGDLRKTETHWLPPRKSWNPKMQRNRIIGKQNPLIKPSLGSRKRESASSARNYRINSFPDSITRSRFRAGMTRFLDYREFIRNDWIHRKPQESIRKQKPHHVIPAQAGIRENTTRRLTENRNLIDRHSRKRESKTQRNRNPSETKPHRSSFCKAELRLPVTETYR